MAIMLPLAIEKGLETLLQIQDGDVIYCNSGLEPVGGTVKQIESDVLKPKATKQALPQLVMIDRSRLLQILNNLLSNSLKFTRTGHILTTIWFDRMPRACHPSPSCQLLL